ncbi:MAG: hypothetical protein VX015_05110 [Planctomycetota bacterium]|nr:hypothetical protein [Planctomycetota bacterium]
MMTQEGLDRLGPGAAVGASPGRAAGPVPGARTDEAQRAEESRASAAFRALLEKFEANAEELRKRTDDLADPRALKEAVSSARRSIDQAVVLGGDLLEAYRASQQRGPGPEIGADQHHSDGPGGGR